MKRTTHAPRHTAPAVAVAALTALAALAPTARALDWTPTVDILHEFVENTSQSAIVDVTDKPAGIDLKVDYLGATSSVAGEVNRFTWDGTKGTLDLSAYSHLKFQMTNADPMGGAYVVAVLQTGPSWNWEQGPGVSIGNYNDNNNPTGFAASATYDWDISGLVNRNEIRAMRFIFFTPNNRSTPNPAMFDIQPIATVPPRLAGDADNDGDVDNADILVWAQNFTGSGVGGKTEDQGDFNGDASVDNADALVWAQNFTGSLGGTTLAAVPEPGMIGLLGVAAFPLLSRARRRRN